MQKVPLSLLFSFISFIYEMTGPLSSHISLACSKTRRAVPLNPSSNKASANLF